MGIGLVGLQTSQKREQVSPPIGPFFSPAAGFDPTFVVTASGIAIPTNAFAHGTPIVWAFLDNTTGHNSSFYTAVQGDPLTERLQVTYPTVKNVLNTTITVDETLAGRAVVVGSTTGFSDFEAPAYTVRTIGCRLTGDGTNTWVKTAAFGVAAMFVLSAYNPVDGSTSFNVNSPAFNVDYDQISITYVGANNYGVRRVYAGLGIYNAKFILIDRATGLPVLASPTANDEIFITNAGTQTVQLLLATWINGNNDWLGTFTNFWITGLFEAWMVASPIGQSAILVRFQPVYPNATNYKVYRDTSPTFLTSVLVYTGTGGAFTDTGLSTDTLYYYKLVGTIAGVDTDITTFRTGTESF